MRQGWLRSDGSDRCQAAGNRGGGKNTGTEVVLVLPAVTVVSLLSGQTKDDTRSRDEHSSQFQEEGQDVALLGACRSLPTTAKGPVCPVAGSMRSECGTNPSSSPEDAQEPHETEAPKKRRSEGVVALIPEAWTLQDEGMWQDSR